MQAVVYLDVFCLQFKPQCWRQGAVLFATVDPRTTSLGSGRIVDASRYECPPIALDESGFGFHFRAANVCN